MKILGWSALCPIAMFTTLVAQSSPGPVAHPSAGPAASVAQGPDTIPALLAADGYAGIPFASDGNYQLVQARIDTTALTLLLDSGYGGDLLLDSSFGTIPGVHLADIPWSSSDASGWQKAQLATVDRVVVDSIGLESQEAVLETFDGPTNGLLGARALNSRQAVVDFATDTLYLFAHPVAPAPTRDRPAAAQPQPTLRAALDAAGQYRTFLRLMQRAGLMHLLEGSPSRDTTLDSLAWGNLRIPAMQQAGASAAASKGERIRLARRAMTQKLRRPGWLTVFAPTDAAFTRLSPEALLALQADTAQLARVLRAHLLTGTRLDTTALRTLVGGAAQPAGAAFGFHVMGPRIDVDRLTSQELGRVVARATIVQPDLTTANGVAHGIDQLLVPSVTPLDKALKAQGYIAVPLSRVSNDWYAVQTKINDTTLTLVIDTGTPWDIALDNGMLEQLNSPQLNSPDGRTLIAFDALPALPVSANEIDLSAIKQSSRKVGERPIDGVVGSGLMIRFRARLDLSRGVLYLRLPTAVDTGSTRPPR